MALEVSNEFSCLFLRVFNYPGTHFNQFSFIAVSLGCPPKEQDIVIGTKKGMKAQVKEFIFCSRYFDELCIQLI